MRTFVGIALEPAVLEWTLQARDAFLACAEGWSGEKWVTAHNLHVTVRFLGELETDAVEEFSDAVGREIAGMRPFRLAMGPVQARPSARRARMLWVACRDVDGGFDRLAEAVERAAVSTDLEGDDRRQVPHITLCRARRSRSVSVPTLETVNQQLRDGAPTMSVPSVTVFSSRLAPQGPEYSEVVTWRLWGE